MGKRCHSEVCWDLDQHTKAKHEILKRYLQAWFPILGTSSQRIVYIDGFAGPGQYRKGEPGSPIIALNTAKNYGSLIKSEIVFWFIEEDSERCDFLKSIIETVDIPDNYKVHIQCGRFDEKLTSALVDIERQGTQLAPTFAFVDPFGISDTPFSILEKILKSKRCEVFINIMSGFISRFNSLEANEKHINELFGTSSWQTEAVRTEEGFIEYYQQRLGTIAEYVRSFAMKSENNQIIYRLIFATNHLEGLKRMKEAMWKVDKTGAFTFSDRTDPNQVLLIPQEPDYRDLRRLILEKFGGCETTVDEIERYVVVETIYRETHFRRQILQPMEKANPPEITVSRNGKTGYPSGTKIKFIPQKCIPRQEEVQVIQDCGKSQSSIWDF